MFEHWRFLYLVYPARPDASAAEATEDVQVIQAFRTQNAVTTMFGAAATPSAVLEHC